MGVLVCVQAGLNCVASCHRNFTYVMLSAFNFLIYPKYLIFIPLWSNNVPSVIVVCLGLDYILL